MKKLTTNRFGNLLYVLSALIVCLSMLSCSKDSDDSILPDDEQLEHLGYIASEKGMKLTYTITEGDELGLTSQMKVTDVKDIDGYRVAYSEISMPGIVINSSGRFNKKETISDGANMPAVYYETLEQIKKGYNTSFTHKENPMTLVIPHQDQAGQVVGQKKILAEWHGVNIEEDTKMVADYTMERSNVVTDGNEIIETAVGKFECLKMTYTATATTTIEITDLITGVVTPFTNIGIMEITMWIAKGIGTVKTTEVMGGTVTTTELTKVEK
ncbi:hypothetical protein [Parapedobacter defluvii]|nr:hypothetical protein [Parapedobacter defluvii]